MIELGYLKEKELLTSLPTEVQNTIESILHVLDSEYGKTRNKYEDDGGYVIIVETIADFALIKANTYIDCDEIIPEYVDKILCSTGEVFTNSLVLCNNDYAISFIILLELTPKNLVSYIVD